MKLKSSLRLATLAFLGVAVFALAAACSDDDDDGDSTGATGSSQPTATGGGGGNLSGAVEIDGSSTVFPITEAVAEEYRSVQGAVQVTVGVSGTGGGFERFCAGETDISDASRPIKADEMAICEAAGIEFIEIPVAYDGLSVVIHPDNDWVSCITVEELNAIWDATSEGTITKWNQVNPEWPDEDLVLYGPGTDSGTFDYFVEVITESEDSRSDYTPSEDDNVLVQGVAGTTNALGYFGLAYLVENQGVITGLEVDGGNGCVAPTVETVESGEYAPLSRPLFIYVKVESAETKPQVEDFINFYLENAATLSADVGYVQFPQAFYDVIGERWESRTAGSIFSGASGSVGEILGVSTTSSSGGGSQTEDLSGAVQIDGSSTVFPITEAVAEEYRNEQGDVQVTVGVSGTGGGFERFCAGETDISDASRPIKADEAEICEAAGIEFIEIPVAYDGLSVVVNPENDWVTCVTVEELNAIWDATSEGTITKWNQVNPEWPDEDLVLYGPGTDSGTFDYFVEVITESEDSRSDYTPSEDDNVLVQGVAGTPNALGYFGLAYLVENQGVITGLEVDGGNGCVAPTVETVESGEYAPLSRPLFIYVKVESAETKPQVEDFINFYLENAATLSADVGYVQFPQAFYDVIGERWESRTAGSIFSGASGSVGEILGVN